MLEVLTSWLEGGGDLVAPELAQARGEICSQCPKNVNANWWEQIAKEPAAQIVKQWLEIKNNLKIGVQAEEDIGLCRVCGCVLRLKIHEPLHYIKEHTDSKTMSDYPDHCWIKKEMTL